jgi:hypothetical protein
MPTTTTTTGRCRGRRRRSRYFPSRSGSPCSRAD